MIGTRAISGLPAIRLRKRTIAALLSSGMASSINVGDLRAVLDLLAAPPTAPPRTGGGSSCLKVPQNQ